MSECLWELCRFEDFGKKLLFPCRRSLQENFPFATVTIYRWFCKHKHFSCMFPLNSRKKQRQGFYMFYPSKKYFNGKGIESKTLMPHFAIISSMRLSAQRQSCSSFKWIEHQIQLNPFWVGFLGVLFEVGGRRGE